MKAQDYMRDGLPDGRFIKGMAVSLLVHATVFLAFLAMPRLMPHRAPEPPLCTVTILSMLDSGMRCGQEGAMGKGDGEPKPAEAQETQPPEEAEKAEEMQLSELKEEAEPLIPVPKKPEKPLKKPRPKPVPSQKPRQVAQTKPPAPAPSAAEAKGISESSPAPPGDGEGLGKTEGEGVGKGFSDKGSGGGVRGGDGPYSVAFGAADGPRFVTKVLPRYPRLAKDLGKEGTVKLLITIDENGRLIGAEVIERAGSGFDEEALKAVQRSTFSPARRNGRPVLCKAQLPIVFRLQE